VPEIALLYSTAGHYRASPRLFHWAGSAGVTILRKALTRMLRSQYGVQILSEHQLRGKMAAWPAIIVPGWEYLAPSFRDELVAYARSGGRLLLIGPGPARLFERELARPGPSAANIVSVSSVDDTFPNVLLRLLPEPIVRLSGSENVDVSPRRLDDALAVHLVNTSGPHANPPVGGIDAISPVGPLEVSIRLPKKPRAIIQQPEDKRLVVRWADGRASVVVPSLEIYSILVVEP
jgi:hypothetical protein